MKVRLQQALFVACAASLIAVACTTSHRRKAPAQAHRPAAAELHLAITADEHGWLLPLVDKKASVRRGGLHAFGRHLAQAGYEKGKDGWLLLSAGDMWTGPYESTVLEGAPMAAAMKHLGFQAVAVGNHEFDFGIETMLRREKDGGFPFLGANLIDDATGDIPDWAAPFVILETGGMRIGVVGMACKESRTTADPRNMRGVVFGEYGPALEKWLPRVEVEGVDEVIVLIHDAIGVIKPLVPILRRHRVHAVAAAHQHVAGVLYDDNGTADADDDVTICNPGPFLRTFCRMDLRFLAGRLQGSSTRHVAVEESVDAEVLPFDDTLKRIVDEAEASAERVGGEVLVLSREKLERGAHGALGELVVDSWLEALPFAQVAITNAGGLRQDIDAGPIRLRDIVSALPFNNYLLVVDVTGAQLKEALANVESIAAGVRYAVREEGGQRVVSDLVDLNGKSIPDTAKLKVIINDFMYRGGDKYRFAQWDREPEETAVDWREPLFRMLRAQGVSGQPLDRRPDNRAR